MTPLEFLEAIEESLREKGLHGDWLNPGATPEQLAQAEAAVGMELPLGWRELYLEHNGEVQEVGLFLGMPWLSLEELVSQWRAWEELRPDYAEEGTHYSLPPGAIRELNINPGWIPLSHDGGGNYLGIDLNPGPEGILGQFINFGRDEELKFVIAFSAEELFRFLYEEIRSPNTVLENGRLCWNEGEALLDALSRMRLPLYREHIEPERPSADLKSWRDELSSPWPDLIRDPEEFLSRRMVHLIRRGLSDVVPLYWCRGALGVFVAGNSIRELAPLSGLPLLRQLHAANNPISTLKGLSDLPNLGVLILDGTEVEDLSPLESFPSLRELALGRTRVRDVEPLVALPRLSRLYLPEGVGDLRPLVALRSLSTLHLYGAGTSLLSGLEELGHLSELILEVGEGASLAMVESCGGLRHLSLHGAQDQDLAFLAGLKHLESLTLFESRVDDLEGLRNHPALRRFISKSSIVENLSALATCPHLREVSGSYEQFCYLHDKVAPGVSFHSIHGGMSPEEASHWREVLEKREASA